MFSAPLVTHTASTGVLDSAGTTIWVRTFEARIWTAIARQGSVSFSFLLGAPLVLFRREFSVAPPVAITGETDTLTRCETRLVPRNLFPAGDLCKGMLCTFSICVPHQTRMMFCHSIACRTEHKSVDTIPFAGCAGTTHAVLTMKVCPVGISLLRHSRTDVCTGASCTSLQGDRRQGFYLPRPSSHAEDIAAFVV